MLSYQDALDYIYGFTDYEKKISTLYGPEHFDLARVERLLARLDSPHQRFRSIHIAGTKGKGSVAAMSESILRAAGYRTSLYTSPHLHTLRERIQVDGRLIPEEAVISLTERLQPLASQVKGITTFEIITALGFLYFAEQGVEFAVLEVGMGGRLDATNVVNPLVAAITSLSYDHTHILGETLPQIAREKAGIIKHKALVVSAPQTPEAMAVIEEACAERAAELTVIGQDWTWQAGEANLEGQWFRVSGSEFRVSSREFWIPLLGRHQLDNAAVAIAVMEKLRQRGVSVPETSIREGLRQVRWPGRLEILGQRPFLVVDCAHNADSARKLKAALEELFTYRRLILIFGASSDKDIEGMMRELVPLADQIIDTQARHPRAAEAGALRKRALALKPGGAHMVSGSVAEALRLALGVASPHDLICATGSVFVVAEAREAWAELQGLEMPERDGES
jgi:dihydrofolate synthase/folylpolyglutamate synthase